MFAPARCDPIRCLDDGGLFMIWLLVGYMWLFVHRPFEVWPWLGALHVERVYMFATILYWAMAAPKTWLSCRNNVPAFLLAGTYVFGAMTSPYANFDYVADWFKILVFYVLLITSIRTERDLRILVIAFVCISALQELHSLREFMCGRHKYEMGVKRLIGVDVTLGHPNSMGASVDYALPFLLPVWTFARRRWQQLAVVAMFVIGAICVLLTGSRSSFVGLAALVGVAAAFSRYRWCVFPTLFVAAVIIWASLREDLQNRYLSLIDPSKGVGAATDSAEGRTKSFLDGMKSFSENPLFGAGLGSYYAKTKFYTHNLYNEAMGELGVFGLLVIVGFAWGIGGDFLESRRLRSDAPDSDEQFLYWVCVAAFSTCLMLFFLGWGAHNLTRHNWLWCGAFSGAAVQFLRQRRLALQNEEWALAADSPYDGAVWGHDAGSYETS